VTALIDGRRLRLELAEASDRRWGLFIGPVQDGIDWRINCERLETLLLEDAVYDTFAHNRRNSPFRLSVAADYIEEYPTSVRLLYHWGNKTLPPTTEFLALVLRSVVE
jgi:hypothetical protein